MNILFWVLFAVCMLVAVFLAMIFVVCMFDPIRDFFVEYLKRLTRKAKEEDREDD